MQSPAPDLFTRAKKEGDLGVLKVGGTDTNTPNPYFENALYFMIQQIAGENFH
jgi:hypothetical protein